MQENVRGAFQSKDQSAYRLQNTEGCYALVVEEVTVIVVIPCVIPLQELINDSEVSVAELFTECHGKRR